MSIKEYKCILCNKLYSSYKTLWDHNKRTHKKENVKDDILKNINDTKIINDTENINNKIIKSSLICENCNKTFSSRQSKSEHKRKACKFKLNSINNNNELLEIKKKNLELEKKNEEISKSLIEIKELLLKNNKMHPKTLEKINKNLIKNTTNNTQNNTINNQNTQNNTINNNVINKTYVNFYEPINYNLLSKKEILKILSKPWKSLEESIKTIHFNKKYPEYSNIIITNLKDNKAHIFDGNKFIVVSKNEVLNNLINSHMDEIESSATEYEEILSEMKLKHLNNFIDIINDNDKKFVHETLKKTYPNLRIYKCDSIKNLIYNNSDPKLLEKLKTMDLINKTINNNEINN